MAHWPGASSSQDSGFTTALGRERNVATVVLSVLFISGRQPKQLILINDSRKKLKISVDEVIN